ncbi:MAG: 4-hydroxy-tetrahydrodipicolinate reductase, partial [Actinobacteria bacterium]|nr:4-hydroxy-tetrahydrodipicolinate reductase [Actinomycetota bacterium]
MIRVGVVGAAGRMGANVCAAVTADPSLELVAAIDTNPGGSTAQGLRIERELKALADAKVDVAVDFTVADAARVTLPWLALHGV